MLDFSTSVSLGLVAAVLLIFLAICLQSADWFSPNGRIYWVTDVDGQRVAVSKTGWETDRRHFPHDPRSDGAAPFACFFIRHRS